MTNADLAKAFEKLSTPLITDAALRLKIPVSVAPHGIQSIVAGTRLAGRALPVQHFGSVDVFLEAMEGAVPGDALVIDNNGRTEEGCIGDLIALEAKTAGLSGMIVWGAHRDTPDLRRIGLPIFSYASCPFGPQRLDPRSDNALCVARFGEFEVTTANVAFADDDGCIFVPANAVEQLLMTAHNIWQTERRQADRIEAGETLRQQLRFSDYLKKREADPNQTFRQHLREIGGAIEE